MSKVGILTFHRAMNYGAVLQTYALQETIKSLGLQPEIIDYRSETVEGNDRHSFRFERIKNFRQFVNLLICQIFLRNKIQKKSGEFVDFINSEYSLSDHSCWNREQLREVCSSYTSVITGSDQVWNPLITRNDPAFLLDFVPENIKRISYAASFGTENLPLEYHHDFKAHLKKFDYVSVREADGQRIVISLISRDADVVLDPTLMLPVEKWNLICDSLSSLSHPYIFIYSLGHDSKVIEIAYAMKRKLNLPVICMGGGIKNYFNRKIDTMVFKGPKTFLQLLRDAAFVVTNSFHGTVFSINYRKPFLTVPTYRPSRILNILNMLELENRLVRSHEVLTDSLCELDFEKPSKLLDQQREKSLCFLKNALQTGGNQ